METLGIKMGINSHFLYDEGGGASILGQICVTSFMNGTLFSLILILWQTFLSKCFKTYLKQVLFTHKIFNTKKLFLVYWPKHINFNLPEDEGLEGARNFYLETDPNVEVGVWHILPRSLVKQSIDKNK